MPLAAQPVQSGDSDPCFIWGGTTESAIDYLRRRGGDGDRSSASGAGGDGRSVYFRDPDGSLIALIAHSSLAEHNLGVVPGRLEDGDGKGRSKADSRCGRRGA